MNLLVIILSLILFSGINTSDTDDGTGIDVLQTLKEKKISCDLHDFVTSVDNPENEYTALMDDLKKYCSESSESTHLSRIVCHMILIELEIGCTLSNKTRPSPVKYINSYTATQVCSIHKITFINKWIWGKLTAREKQQLGSSWVELCPKITAFNTTLRLTRFFYKIAPRIRRAEAQHRISLLNKTSPALVANKLQLVKEKLLENSKNTSGDEIDQKYQLSINQTRRKTKLKNKLPAVLDLKPEQSKSNITKRKTRRKQFLDNDDDGSDGNIIDSGDLDGQQKKVDSRVRIEDDHKQEPADLKKVDDKEMKAANRLNNNGDIFPLGRGGEKPEREQMNERPKPRALEIENVFKPNERERQNWVEGQHAVNEEPHGRHANINSFPRMKHEENPLKLSGKGKKKFLLRSRSNRYRDDDFDNWTNKFTTSSLIFFLLIIVIYLVLHNKNKIIGLIIEGCRRRRGIYGRRFSGLTRHSRLSQSS